MKIVLVRVDGIGDAIVCAPLVAALRDAGHELGAVLGTNNASAFARRAFKHVHVLQRIAWPEHGSTPASRKRALAEMLEVGYDVALIASEEPDAYALARDAKIARRVGFTNGWEKPLKTFRLRSMLTRAVERPASAKRANEHEVQTLFRLGEGLHSESEPTRDLDRLRELVLDEPIVKSTHVVVQVSKKNETSGLSRDGYIALTRALAGSGFRVSLLGDEPSLIEPIVIATNAMNHGLLGVAEWKARIAGARGLITPDSGAAQIAGMVGTPTVDCFPGEANSRENIARWSPWAGPHRSIAMLDAPPEFMAGALVAEFEGLLALHGPRR